MALVDVLVAAAILALALIPVIQLFSAAGRQAYHASGHGQSLALLTKVADELRLASWENPYLLDGIDTLTRGGQRDSAVGGASPLLATLEDRRAPLGRIAPESDGGITADASALYRQLATHRIGLLPPTGVARPEEPVSFAAVAAWNNVTDRGVEARVALDLARF